MGWKYQQIIRKETDSWILVVLSSYCCCSERRALIRCLSKGLRNSMRSKTSLTKRPADQQCVCPTAAAFTERIEFHNSWLPRAIGETVTTNKDYWEKMAVSWQSADQQSVSVSDSWCVCTERIELHDFCYRQPRAIEETVTTKASRDGGVLSSSYRVYRYSLTATTWW